MNRISILDCTLRDGGYVNEFKFGNIVIKKIIEEEMQIQNVGINDDILNLGADSLTLMRIGNGLGLWLPNLDTYYPSEPVTPIEPVEPVIPEKNCGIQTYSGNSCA